MATRFEATMTYDAAPEDVFAMYLDPDYQVEKLLGTGGDDIEVTIEADDDGGSLQLDRTLPAQVPSFAQKFIGETVTVRERHEWDAASADGTRTGRLTATFEGTPLSLSGDISLTPDGDSTVFTLRGEAKAGVPLVGGKLEGIVRDQVMRAARKEEQIGRDWLTR